jgi:hypothetical protein
MSLLRSSIAFFIALPVSGVPQPVSSVPQPVSSVPEWWRSVLGLELDA